MYYTLIHSYERLTENYQEYPRQILFKILQKTALILLSQPHASIEKNIITYFFFSKEGGLDHKIHSQRVFIDFTRQYR